MGEAQELFEEAEGILAKDHRGGDGCGLCKGSGWIEILAASPKPAVVVIDAGELYDPLCRQIEAAGVPVFRKIDRAARALAAFCRGLRAAKARGEDGQQADEPGLRGRHHHYDRTDSRQTRAAPDHRRNGRVDERR